MKLTISIEQHDFFQENHAIEFAGLLTQKQVENLRNSVEVALSERLKIEKKQLQEKSPFQLFTAGHDLWRSDLLLQQNIRQAHLAEIASELIGRKSLRLGYDQIFYQRPLAYYHSKESNVYTELLQKHCSLQEMSCLQGSLCGVLLCLSDPIDQRSQETPSEANVLGFPLTLFPKQAGSGIFFDADAKIDFSHLFQHQYQYYLMIVYTYTSAVYVLNEKDPFLQSFKDLGYSYGDRLSDKSNPIICRERG